MDSDSEKQFFKKFIGKKVWLLKEDNNQPYSIIGKILDVNNLFLTIEMDKDVRIISLDKIKEIKIKKEAEK